MTAPTLSAVERAEVLEQLDEIVRQIDAAERAVKLSDVSMSSYAIHEYLGQRDIYTAHARSIAQRTAARLRGEG